MVSVTNVSIFLAGSAGEPLGKLRPGAGDINTEAEAKARRENIAKSSALSQTLRASIEAAGYSLTDQNLAEALQTLNRFRAGEMVRDITVVVSPLGTALNGSHGSAREPRPSNSNATPPMKPTSPPPIAGSGAVSFFEAERIFPDSHAQAWYERLVGLDDHKERLLVELEMLLFPERVESWSKEHHGGKVLRLLELYRNRVPLILFEGDVGTGKTALAETVGDALARRLSNNTKVHLLKLNTQVRGTGLVGEMSDLIAQAFTQAEARARALKGEPVLLLIDEADALAASRDTQQMHHEDKAGLNTVLQRLDNLRLTQLPIAALFITNRPEALDPAVRRRAALDLRFLRPNDAIRAEIIASAVPELTITRAKQDELVKLTGPKIAKNQGVGFTASDITDRLLPGALRAAYIQRRGLTVDDLIDQAHSLEATPPFGQGQGSN